MKKIKDNGKVVLLHGIGLNHLYMASLERYLQKAGYDTLNIHYPSVKENIGSLTVWLAERLEELEVWQNAQSVHFVGHSMGGLVIGGYLQNNKHCIPADKMGRVVMLGTPHHGSEIADFLQQNPLYKWGFGPAGQELTLMARAQEQIVPWYDLGIIAGTKNGYHPLGMLCINGVNDGCVSLESTKLEGMRDHISLPVMHVSLAWSPAVHRQVRHFLKNGEFVSEK